MKLPVTITTNYNKDKAFLKEYEIEEYNLMLKPTDLESMDNCLRALRELKLLCVSMHSPFIKNVPLVIEDVLRDRTVIRKTLVLASKIADLMNEKLPLVFHTAFRYNTSDLVTTVAPILKPLLPDNIYICLENSIDVSLNEDDLVLDKRSTPIVAQRYSEAVGRKIFYTCLDVCHATIVCRYIGRRKAEHAFLKSVPTISEYCSSFGDNCKLIHLANTLSHGLCKAYHGRGFNPDNQDDVKYLHTIFNAIDKFNPNAKIVLEVSEDNYNTRPNVKMTLDCLNKYF